jgi:hypothetical protein
VLSRTRIRGVAQRKSACPVCGPGLIPECPKINFVLTKNAYGKRFTLSLKCLEIKHKTFSSYSQILDLFSR